MKILAIESSCDETAAAVIEKDKEIRILSNVIASQIDIHKKYGGVFPEIASRAHTENIIPVVEQALAESNKSIEVIKVKTARRQALLMKGDTNNSITSLLHNIDLIAVTFGPGLIGSLLVGVNFAKTLSFVSKKPIIGINHILGHIYSNFSNGSIEFPAIILVVSGGHTGLYLMKSHNDITTLGETLDDAAGEAFDKVAKLLGLGYPGGPKISKYAEKVKKNEKILLPRPMVNSGDYNFSFSGLKTAVLNLVKKQSELSLKTKKEIAAEFQQAVIDTLISKTLKAVREHHPKSVCLCGGVSANKELRNQMKSAINSYNLKFKIYNFKISFHVPPLDLTTDNAAMIGLAAAYQDRKKYMTYDRINAQANLAISA